MRLCRNKKKSNKYDRVNKRRINEGGRQSGKRQSGDWKINGMKEAAAAKLLTFRPGAASCDGMCAFSIGAFSHCTLAACDSVGPGSLALAC